MKVLRGMPRVATCGTRLASNLLSHSTMVPFLFLLVISVSDDQAVVEFMTKKFYRVIHNRLIHE